MTSSTRKTRPRSGASCPKSARSSWTTSPAASSGASDAPSALSILEERLRPAGQRLSWLADSQVAIIPAPGPAVTVQAVTRRTVTAWGLHVDDTAHLSWIAAKGGHRCAGQEVNPIVVAKLKAAGLVTDAVVHGSRAKRNEKGEEQLRFTDEARFALCLDE